MRHQGIFKATMETGHLPVLCQRLKDAFRVCEHYFLRLESQGKAITRIAVVKCFAKAGNLPVRGHSPSRRLIGQSP